MTMLVNPFRFGGGGGGTATNWRIAVDKNAYLEFEAAVNCAIAEVEMRETAGGADQCTGGTATSPPGGNPTRAFDNNGGTWWNPGGSFPFFLQYAFSSGKSIVEVAITSRTDEFIGDTPTEFRLQTNDGSPVDVATFKTGPWGPGETRIFNVSTFVDQPERFVRVRPTGIHGNPVFSRFSISGVEFRTTSGGANIATGGVAFARDYQGANVPARAFDGTLSTRYGTRVSGNFPRNYIGYYLPTAIGDDVVEVALTCTNETFGPDEAPTGFHVEYGSGNVWTNLWTESSIPSWTAGETKVFTKP